LEGAKNCSATCKKFRCGKNAIAYHGDKTWCKWTDEPCEVKNCSYAVCLNRRLLPGAVCGETVRRKTSEKGIEDIGPTVRVKGKAYRKIGERELF